MELLEYFDRTCKLLTLIESLLSEAPKPKRRQGVSTHVPKVSIIFPPLIDLFPQL